MDQRDDARHFRAESASVHHQSAAHRARNSFAKLKAGESQIDDALDQATESGRGTGPNMDASHVDPLQTLTEPDHKPANAAIAHQQVCPQTKTEVWDFMAARRCDCESQFGFACDRNHEVGRPADLKRSKTGERLAPREVISETDSEVLFKLVHRLPVLG